MTVKRNPALHWIAVALAALILSVSFAWAQFTDEQSAYFEKWQATAARADEVIAARRASNAALEELRKDLVRYRETFQKLRNSNAARIRTLEEQIAALGPPPEDGQTEPEEIARLREELNRQLTQARVPGIVAEQAYSRANGLIAEIDRIIRDRQKSELLHRGPSPLNPAHWGEALAETAEVFRGLAAETQAQISAPSAREQRTENAPFIAGLIALGLLLLFRARAWSHQFGDYMRQFGGRGTGVWNFLVSVAVLALQFAGVVAIVNAVRLSGSLGFRGSLVLDAVPVWAAILLFYAWLNERLFDARHADAIVFLSPQMQDKLRRDVTAASWLLVLQGVVGLLAQIETLSEATRAVIAFPGIVLTALVLYHINRLTRSEEPKEREPSERTGLIRLVRRIVRLLGMTAPLLAAIGYTVAAEALIYPAVLTLTLFSVGVILQRFLTDLYGWLSGKGCEARDSLFAVLAGGLIALGAVPVLALIWGARIADLSEIWAKFLAGFQIGDTRISPTAFLGYVLVFAIGYVLTRLVQSGLRTSLLPKTGLDPGGQNAVVAGTGYVGIFIAAMVAISTAGIDLSSIALVAGALSVGIGFGLQTIVSNFVSGIILLIERPFAIGDWIEVNGLMGYVRDISVRSTRIETFDRTDVIVPNSDFITGTVTNYTRGNTVGRAIVPVGVAYGSDTRKVEKILLEIANAHPMVLANPAPMVVFQGFGADSLDFEIRAILRDVNWVLSVKSDLNYEIERRFREEGIEIPFSQRDIWLRNPEALARALDGTAPEPDPAPAPPTAPSRPDTRTASAAPTPPDLNDMDADSDR
ncbi:Small-conductance mechanosensitive channel [Jhaorihella thermophila]|uniref:Small-conductance mechanosensitive channel n=1 Tax=Jhaorihella thermophila TaxID=488547 RepID=A0A1H5SK37_9RHOB|nr:Small-conductance mechanosensitive channel [Jhaorihella thermophila]